MFKIEISDDEILREESLKKVNRIEINKDNLNTLNEDDILFIMNSSEEDVFFSKDKYYFEYNKYSKDITEEEVMNIFPKFKKTSADYQVDYKAINLGMGHALLIKDYIYNDYMKILRNDITYEDQFNPEEIYAAWNHWIDCAIKYIDKFLK